MVRDLILKLLSFGGRDRCRVGERKSVAFGKRVKHEFEFHLRGSHFATQQRCSQKSTDTKARQNLQVNLLFATRVRSESTDMNGPRLGS